MGRWGGMLGGMLMGGLIGSLLFGGGHSWGGPGLMDLILSELIAFRALSWTGRRWRGRGISGGCKAGNRADRSGGEPEPMA